MGNECVCVTIEGADPEFENIRIRVLVFSQILNSPKIKLFCGYLYQNYDKVTILSFLICIKIKKMRVNFIGSDPDPGFFVQGSSPPGSATLVTMMYMRIISPGLLPLSLSC